MSAPDPSSRAADPLQHDARELVNLILIQAVQERAGDVHFDPTQDGGGRVRMRVDGVLRELSPLPRELYGAVLRRVKQMAGLDLSETEQPQDGRMELSINNRDVAFGVSTLRTITGERLILRLVSREKMLVELPQVVDADDLEPVRSLCRGPDGLVICAGPLFSGKTTLMHAMVMEVPRDQALVMTVEDPVEVTLPDVVHVPVQPQAGLTFPRALQQVLRHAPNVIMIGEIRDLETLQLAATAAANGHLVFTQLPTSTTIGTLRWLMDIGLEPFRVNQSVRAVIAQRLARRPCPDCRRPMQPALHSLPPEVGQYVKDHPNATFYESGGCEKCGNTGFSGRGALHEILVMNERIREAIASGARPQGIYDAAVASGMKPFLIDGIHKSAKGLTSLEEVMRAIPQNPVE